MENPAAPKFKGQSDWVILLQKTSASQSASKSASWLKASKYILLTDNFFALQQRIKTAPKVFSKI